MTIATPPTDDSPRVQAALDSLLDATQRFTSVAFANSLGKEDMVLTDMIARHALPIRIFTLNTGKLHSETLALLAAAREHYRISIEAFEPDRNHLTALARTQSDTAIYEGIAERKACCKARKIEPLQRALQGATAWITGQRRAQSVTRASLALEEHDAAHQMAKLNPLAHWSDAEIDQYLRRRFMPINALHARGFPSIGCAPCTRAIAPGEDERAGRWWWENPEQKECGLHNNPRRPLPPIVSRSPS